MLEDELQSSLEPCALSPAPEGGGLPPHDAKTGRHGAPSSLASCPLSVAPEGAVGCKLLVVEDDEDDYFLIRRMLQNGATHAQVERASTVDDALQHAAQHPYDLFVLDYRLGDKDGLDLLRELKHRDAAAPIIFLTGQGDEEVAVQAMKAGATDYLSKAKLSAPSLNMAVRYAMNLRHKEEAVRAARRALHVNERRFRALVENSGDIVLLLDMAATIVYISQSVQRVLGYRPAEVLDTSAFDYVHPDDLPQVKEVLTLVLQSPGVPLRAEYRLRHNQGGLPAGGCKGGVPGKPARLQAVGSPAGSREPEAGSQQPCDGGWRVVEATMMNRLEDAAVGAIVINARDITERRQAEEALRISEREYRTLFENANDAILIFEPETETILEANPQACSTYGFPHDELLGMSLKQITQDVARGEAAVAKILKHGRLRDFETLRYRKDGSPLHILANASAIEYRGKTAVLSIGRDITERKLAERETRKLHSAVEQSADPVFITGRDGIIQYVNPAFVTLTGYAREEAVGKTPRVLKSGHHDPAFYEQLWATILSGEVYRDVVINRKKNGDLYYAEKTITPVLDEAGQITHFISNDRDITGRILSERQRLRAEEDLRASEHKYRMLVETANEGIWAVDAEDRTTFVNAKMAAMLGYEPAQLLSRPIYEFVVDPELAQRWLQRLRAGATEQADAVLRRRDGSQLYAILSSNPVFDRNRHYAGAFAMITDITERRLLEEQLRHSQKMDAVGQLAGGVAHDFNNLLMVISSYAELLSDSLQHDPKALREADQILKAARRAAGLTRQLLAFSRKQVLAPRLLDLNSVLADFGRMLPRLIGEDVEVVLKPGADLWQVKADPVQIEQVLMNLAVNARDAMPQGGRLSLETANLSLDETYARRHATVTPGDYVMLAVADTGSGIPPETLPRIFEPFFTTKEQGKGTGLGLPTVYGIVKQSGGFVWVYSEVGRGTAFKVYLPRAAETPQQPLAPAAPEPAPRGYETVLLVEDEEAVRESASEFLTLRGYTVLQAKDGNDALQVLEHYAGNVHLLITDVIMPGMSGGELGKRIATARPALRVLYISGYTETMVERHGIDPATAFLQKPFSLSALGRKVREVLDQGAPQDKPAEQAQGSRPKAQG